MTDGDVQAARFERAYRDTYPAVTGYVMRRATSPADAADAIAETYLTLWRRLDDLPERADLRLWLYGVARRVMANQRRSVRRSSALADRLAAELSALPKRFVEEPPADLAHIARAYGRLSRADQELLALLAWEGLSREEIAVTLGVSRPVIRLRLHRARQRMAHELANDQSDETQRGYTPVPLEQGKAWS